MKRNLDQAFRQAVAQRRSTLLGVGPMSVNVVEAALRVARDCDAPIALIASRRQIDSAEWGGGYVNNWTSETFAAHMRQVDPEHRLLLARDHGGPWQNTGELTKNLSLKDAMASAKRSYEADIDAGFDLLHIDPSVDPSGAPSFEVALERILDLYEHCWAYARRRGRNVLFEIGTEEQSGTTNTVPELEMTLTRVAEHCARHGLPKPTFVVVQTGTKVKEMRNMGRFAGSPKHAGGTAARRLNSLVDACERHGVLLKEHNADYLTDGDLASHPGAGIHAANVAPEFGVAESRALMAVLDETGLHAARDRFVELSIASKKWDKWLLPESTATRTEKALIAGHYVFSNPEFVAAKREWSEQLKRKGVNLDETLIGAVEASIRRYARAFNLETSTASRSKVA